MPSVGSSSRCETVLLVSNSINNLPRFVKGRGSPLIRQCRLERLIPKSFLKHRLFFNFYLQRLQRLLNQIEAQLPLLIFGQCWIP